MLPFSPRLCLGVSLPLGQLLGTLQTTPPAGMEGVTLHQHKGQVMVTPMGWAGTDGHWAGHRAVGDDATPPQQRECGSPQCVRLIPCPGSPRHPDPHRARTGVSTPSHGWERAGAPSCPRFAGGRIASPGLGWIQPAIGLWQALISPPAVNFPPQRSGATGSAGAGRVPFTVPRHPGSPNSTDLKELRDGGMFSRRNARSPPLSHPGVWWMGGHGAVPAGSGFGAGKG